jgi:hypothetical protein
MASSLLQNFIGEKDAALLLEPVITDKQIKVISSKQNFTHHQDSLNARKTEKKHKILFSEEGVKLLLIAEFDNHAHIATIVN